MRFVRTLSLYAALLVLTLVAYVPVWNNGFTDFDDDIYITTNPEVLNGFTWSGFRWVWTIDRAPYWMPLTWLSFQLDAQCFGVQTPEGERVVPPAAVHGQNLLWHAAGVLVLFGLCRRLTGRWGASFLVAALFAVHPMHVESVAWAAERKDVLSVFFGLLALAAYVRYAHKPNWLIYLALCAAYGVSLLCKPMLLTLPFVLLLLDYWPLGRLRGNAAVWKRLLLEKAPLFLMAITIAAVTLQARESRGALVSLCTVSFTARLANALTAYGWYIVTTFYPTSLAHLYPHPYDNWSMQSALVGAGLLLACTLVAWQQRRRRPWLIVGWLWFVGALLPVIGFAQGGKQAWADRFSYWPHIGLFLAVACELAAWVERFRVRAWVCRLAAAGVLGWLACLTWGQLGFWLNPLTLWQHTLDVTGDNDQAHEHLARHYAAQGREDLTLFHLGEAVRIQRQRFGAMVRTRSPAGPPIGPASVDSAAPGSLSYSERGRLVGWPMWCWSRSARFIPAALRPWVQLAFESTMASWLFWWDLPAAARLHFFG